MAQYVKLHEVCVRLEIDDALLRTLAEEGLVEIVDARGEEPVVSAEVAERLRVITLLMREMEVNLAGVEVILHMREEIRAMQRQFDEILNTVVEEVRKRVGR